MRILGSIVAPSTGSIEKRPAFEQYWERIGMRLAALRASEIDDALIAQHKQTSTAG
jgi:glutathione S-transferase